MFVPATRLGSLDARPSVPSPLHRPGHALLLRPASLGAGAADHPLPFGQKVGVVPSVTRTRAATRSPRGDTYLIGHASTITPDRPNGRSSPGGDNASSHLLSPSPLAVSSSPRHLCSIISTLSNSPEHSSLPKEHPTAILLPSPRPDGEGGRRLPPRHPSPRSPTPARTTGSVTPEGDFALLAFGSTRSEPLPPLAVALSKPTTWR